MYHFSAHPVTDHHRHAAAEAGAGSDHAAKEDDNYCLCTINCLLSIPKNVAFYRHLNLSGLDRWRGSSREI